MSVLVRMRLFCLAGALLVFGCLQPDSTAPGGNNAPVTIGDEDRLSGATSSTNWPTEDAGTQPIQVSGTADSVLSLSFRQAPSEGMVPVPTRLAATVLLYRSGYNPLFDSIPTLRLEFPASDTFKLSQDDFKPLIQGDIDTLRFTVEIRTDTVRGIFPGFTYSIKGKKFLEWPYPINEVGTKDLSNPHYKFGGLLDGVFRSFQSDTSGNAKFYYYIPGSPYFWQPSFGHDSLYIGPTVKGRLPLRCVRVRNQPGPKAGFTIVVYALSLVEELVNDSINHSQASRVFKLGNELDSLYEQGAPRLRSQP